MAQRGTDRPVTAGLELVTYRLDPSDEFGFISRNRRRVAFAGAWHAYQSTSSGGEQAVGPEITDSRASWPMWVFLSPFEKLDLQRLAPDQALQRANLRLALPKRVGGLGLFIEGAGFELGHPGQGQVTRYVVAHGTTTKGLSSEILRRGLAYEL